MSLAVRTFDRFAVSESKSRLQTGAMVRAFFLTGLFSTRWRSSRRVLGKLADRHIDCTD